MTVASKDWETSMKPGNLVSYPMIDDDVIYAGTMVGIHVGHATKNGYIAPAENAQLFKFTGVAAEQGDNTGTGHSAGAVNVNVYKTGSFVFAYNGTVTSGLIGKQAFIVDDKTVGIDSADTAFNILAGEIVGVDTTNDRVRVRIDDAVDRFPEIRYVPAAASADVARGDLIAFADGDYADEVADTSNYTFAGVAIQAVENTDTAGSVNIPVVMGLVHYLGSKQAIATYKVNEQVYADADSKFDNAAGTANVDMPIGRITRKAAAGNYAYVYIQNFNTT